MVEFHEIANIFPLISGGEFQDLVEDIRRNGLLEPIWLHEGKILDGRNRYLACQSADVEPRFKTWNGECGSPVAFVIAMNMHRRHLDSSQRAACAVAAMPYLEEEAKRRESERKKNINNPTLTKEKIPESSGRSRDQAAAMFGTNGRYVQEAKKLAQNEPELFERVKAGELTIPRAKQEVAKKAKQEPKQEVFPASKSPILFVGRAESMPQIPNESVDLIITSPPYNIGSDSWPMGGNGRTPRTNGIGYDHHADEMPEQEYQAWQLACLSEMHRVAKPGASLFYNHKVRVKNGYLIHPMAWLGQSSNPWIVRQEIIWDRRSTHNHSAQIFWPEDERIYWMTKGKPTLPDHPIGMSTIWKFHGPYAGTWHPAPFPEELPTRCIEAIGRDGITVLDPFAGSCTTLKVALSYGYDAIGVDISEEYLKQAMQENGWTNGSEPRKVLSEETSSS